MDFERQYGGFVAFCRLVSRLYTTPGGLSVAHTGPQEAYQLRTQGPRGLSAAQTGPVGGQTLILNDSLAVLSSSVGLLAGYTRNQEACQ